ncbi:unnamed protein product [Clonostachys solani]|uniref:Uncharacterized protein n=1 Tax=Clonostachys solani TaxID=160281 RepID=A0A9P0EJK8_9HYPO|nr:unnamed protein product [Clonostachys solani]
MEHSSNGFSDGAHSHNANVFAGYLQSRALVTLEYLAVALPDANIDNLPRNCKDMSNYQLSHRSGIYARKVNLVKANSLLANDLKVFGSFYIL